MSEYSRCRVCGKELSEPLAAYARRRLQQTTCSTECSRRDLIQRFGCCEKAQLMACVCTYAFKCPVHGERHLGTHD